MNANAIITRSAQAVAAALIVTAEVLVFQLGSLPLG
jgi:hypothetical protein